MIWGSTHAAKSGERAHACDAPDAAKAGLQAHPCHAPSVVKSDLQAHADAEEGTFWPPWSYDDANMLEGSLQQNVFSETLESDSDTWFW